MNEAPPTIEGFSGFRLIGRGGSALVFRARQDQLERDVALKVLRLGLSDERTRALFDVERRALGRLPKHQNIVTVFGSGFTLAGDPYLSMELCPSGSLASLVKGEGPLGVELTARCGLRVAGALAIAHRNNMVHRDVKPENVLISDQGEPVLSDFGIASLIEQDSTATEGAWSPNHVAPEVLRGTRPSEVTDLYSLGSTLFTLLVGHAPHLKQAGERLPISTILNRVVDMNWVPAIPDQLDVPRELRLVILSLLSKDPRRRITPADEVVAAFRRVEKGIDSEHRTLMLPTRHLDDLVLDNRQAADEADDATHLEKGNRSFGLLNRTSSRSARSSRDVSSRPTDADGLGVDPSNSVSFGKSAEADPQRSSAMFDVDATMIARQPGTPRVEPFATAESLQPVPASTPTSAPKMMAFLGLILVCVVGLVAFTARRNPEAVSIVTTAMPGGVVSGPINLYAPPDVSLRQIGSAVEVFWTPHANPGVSYEVEVVVGAQRVDFAETAQPPVTVKSRSFEEGSACVRVRAIDQSTRRGVDAVPVCGFRVAADSTSDTRVVSPGAPAVVAP